MSEPLRKCTKCGKEANSEEELELFIKNKNVKHGRENECTTCAKERKQKWSCKNRDTINKNRNAVRFKNKDKCIKILGSSCKRCGLEYDGTNSIIFDFHHLDPKEKEHTPATLMDSAWSKIEKEISKCVLLCANCHRLEHQPEF